MLYQFVVAPILAVVCVVFGVAIFRQRRAVGRWRKPVTVGGLAAVAFGLWVLGSVIFNLTLLLSVRPEQMEEAVRRGMAETNGEEPQSLKLTPAGWWRLTGTAKVQGRPVDVTAELRVEGGGVRTIWEQRPAGGG